MNAEEYNSLIQFETTELTLSQIPEPVPESLTEEQINEKYLKGEVRIVTEQARYPLNTIKSLVESPNYIMHPEFQRRHRWDRLKQSHLIESFIINIPIPPIFLYETDFSVYEVMDGLQRLTAIKEFYEDKFPLEGLEKWPELNGKNYSNLPEQVRKGIDRRYLSSVILLKETAKSPEEANLLKQLVFARINSGGAKLEDQESRNAQFSSPFNTMLIRLSRNNEFCDIFDIPSPTADENLENDDISEELKENSLFSTMKDVEHVLRFFALRSIDLWSKCTFSGFLDRYLLAMKDTNDVILQRYEKLFCETIHLVKELYSDYAFCARKKMSDDSFTWGKRPLVYIYDPMMLAVSYNLEYAPLLIQKKDEVLSKTCNLLETSDFLNGRNVSNNQIKIRKNLLMDMFKEIINAE